MAKVSLQKWIKESWFKEWGIPEPEFPRYVVENLDGVEWYKAPIPSRFHRCTPQTRGGPYGLIDIYRCACGAITETGCHGWLNRNSRRKNRS
jgi:hypothetical protein